MVDKKFLFQLIFILGLMAASSFSVRANDRVLTVSLFDIAPWGGQKEDGTIHGVTYDMFEAISQNSGMKFEYSVVPYKRMLSNLETGKSDVSIFFQNELSEGICEQVSYVYKEENVVVSLKGTDLKRYSDVAEQIIASPRGVPYLPMFDNDQTLKKVNTDNHVHSIKLLLRGRVTAIAGPYSSLIYNFKQFGVGPSDIGYAFVLGKKESWLQFSKATMDQETVDKLNITVHAMAEEGVFKDILNKYFD